MSESQIFAVRWIQQNSFSPEAPLRTPLGEFTTLSQTPWSAGERDTPCPYPSFGVSISAVIGCHVPNSNSWLRQCSTTSLVSRCGRCMFCCRSIYLASVIGQPVDKIITTISARLTMSTPRNYERRRRRVRNTISGQFSANSNGIILPRCTALYAGRNRLRRTPSS